MCQGESHEQRSKSAPPIFNTELNQEIEEQQQIIMAPVYQNQHTIQQTDVFQPIGETIDSVLKQLARSKGNGEIYKASHLSELDRIIILDDSSDTVNHKVLVKKKSTRTRELSEDMKSKNEVQKKRNERAYPVYSFYEKQVVFFHDSTRRQMKHEFGHAIQGERVIRLDNILCEYENILKHENFEEDELRVFYKIFHNIPIEKYDDDITTLIQSVSFLFEKAVLGNYDNMNIVCFENIIKKLQSVNVGEAEIEKLSGILLGAEESESTLIPENVSKPKKSNILVLNFLAEVIPSILHKIPHVDKLNDEVDYNKYLTIFDYMLKIYQNDALLISPELSHMNERILGGVTLCNGLVTMLKLKKGGGNVEKKYEICAGFQKLQEQLEKTKELYKNDK